MNACGPPPCAPWPGEGGRFFAARTLETWWYDYTKSGFAGITGKAKRRDAGKSRALDEELGLWIIESTRKSPGVPLSVLYRSWEDHGRVLPSESTVRRFLCANGLDARSLNPSFSKI